MSGPADHVSRITGGRAGIRSHVAELRHNLVVAYFLVSRDLKVRYRQTLLGATWIVLQPVALALVLAVFLGRFVGVPTDGVPYGLFAITGLVSWSYLSGGVEAGTASFVNDVNLISKVYVPRLVIPLSAALSYVVDLALGSFVALVYTFGSGIAPSPRWLLIVPVGTWAAALACGLGVLLGTLNVKFRDVRAGVRFAIQMWLFITPVAYSWTVVPEHWRAVYGLNPAAGVVSLARWTYLGGEAPPAALLATSAIVTGAVCLLGLRVFDVQERDFADSI